MRSDAAPGPPMTREALLAALLRLAHERGWPLARLDGATDPAAPFHGADADLLADWRPWSDWLGLSRAAAGDSGWVIVNAVPMGGVLSVWAADPAATDEVAGTAQLDFHRALSACGVPFLDPVVLFARAAPMAGALRLRVEDACGARALEKWLVHGGILPADAPADLIAAAVGGAAAAIRGRTLSGRSARQRALPVALRRRPGLALRLLAAKIGDNVRRLARPPGLLLAVSGPDGAGKSSLIAALEKAIPRRLAPGFRVFHTRPFLLPRFGVAPPAPPPGDAPPSKPGWARGWFRWAVACADYWLGGLLWVRPALAAGDIVIFDRYVLDYQAAPERRGVAVPARALALMARVAPSPGALVVLTAPAEELVRRKGEATLEEAARQNRVYVRLAAAAPGGLVVDSGALDPAAVAARVRRHLIEVMSGHARPDRP